MAVPNEQDVKTYTIEEVANVIEELMQFIPNDAMRCHGYKCREPWCVSCFGEELVDEYLSDIEQLQTRVENLLKSLVRGD